MKRFLYALVLLPMLLLSGCAGMNDMAHMRNLTFDFAGVSDARLCGIAIGPGASYSNLSLADVARLTAALLVHEAPLEATMHVRASNPAANRVAATLSRMDWTLFVDDRRVLAGGLAHRVEFHAGQSSDIPLGVRIDLLTLGVSGARDIYNLALAIAGQGTISKELRLELVPTVDTPMGPMTYPNPVIVRRAAR